MTTRDVRVSGRGTRSLRGRPCVARRCLCAGLLALTACRGRLPGSEDRAAFALGPPLTGDHPPRPSRPVEPGVTDDEVRVGVYLPLRGDRSALGHALLAGALLAVVEAERTGGVRGRHVRLVVGDEAAPGGGQPAYVGLLEREEVMTAALGVNAEPLLPIDLGYAAMESFVHVAPAASGVAFDDPRFDVALAPQRASFRAELDALVALVRSLGIERACVVGPPSRERTAVVERLEATAHGSVTVVDASRSTPDDALGPVARPQPASAWCGRSGAPAPSDGVVVVGLDEARGATVVRAALQASPVRPVVVTSSADPELLARELDVSEDTSSAFDGVPVFALDPLASLPALPSIAPVTPDEARAALPDATLVDASVVALAAPNPKRPALEWSSRAVREGYGALHAVIEVLRRAPRPTREALRVGLRAHRASRPATVRVSCLRDGRARSCTPR